MQKSSKKNTVVMIDPHWKLELSYLRVCVVCGIDHSLIDSARMCAGVVSHLGSILCGEDKYTAQVHVEEMLD
jgi:hypothetical protein